MLIASPAFAFARWPRTYRARAAAEGIRKLISFTFSPVRVHPVLHCSVFVVPGNCSHFTCTGEVPDHFGIKMCFYLSNSYGNGRSVTVRAKRHVTGPSHHD